MLTYECIVCPPVGQDVKETKLKSFIGSFCTAFWNCFVIFGDVDLILCHIVRSS